MLFDIYSDISFGILYYTWSRMYIYCILTFYLAFFLAYLISHCIWGFILHSVWHVFWHSISHTIWHILTFYPTYCLTYFWTFYLTFCWHSIWHFIWHKFRVLRLQRAGELAIMFGSFSTQRADKLARTCWRANSQVSERDCVVVVVLCGFAWPDVLFCVVDMVEI